MLDGTSHAGSAAQAEAEFAAAVRENFGARCKAAWLSGSFLYRGAEEGRSDIDVVVVMDEKVAAPADGETLARIRGFVDAYLGVHARRGLDPDLDFPGEYVTPAAIEQAIAWRGLATDGGVADEFPIPDKGSDYWIARPDRWFHAWLSMTAFTRFLAGDRAYHERVKLDAWKSVIRFLLLRADGAPLTMEAMWPGLAQFGVKPKYRAFWPLERDWVRRALGELEAEGAVEPGGGRIVPGMERLREWERGLEAAIAANDSAGPLLLPPDLHREIGAHAARRWEAMAPQPVA